MVPRQSKTTDDTKSDTNAVSTRNQSTTVCYTYKDKVVIDYQFRCEQDSIISEYPLYVKFSKERGIDEGGVQRDMFTAFWDDAYTRLFEGSATVIPMVHSHMDMSTLVTLGKIISHGYLATGIIPDRIALPSLLAALLSPGVRISRVVLLDAFLNYISTAEREIFKGALEVQDSFQPDLLDQIIGVLSRFGCRVVPTLLSLTNMIEQAARYEFCLKPAAALATIYSGIPLCHKPYWNKKSPDEIAALHSRLTANPSKVLAMLDASTIRSPAEE